MHTSPFTPARHPAAPQPTGPRWIGRWCRWVWWSVTAVVTTVGVGAAFVLLGAIGALVLVGLGTAGTTLVRFQLRQDPGGRRTWPAVMDLLGGWSLAAVVGLAAEFSAGGVLVSAVVVALRAVPLCSRRRAGRSDAIVTRSPPPDVPPAELIPCDPLPQPFAVPGLTTAQVCWTWRLSYVGMHRPDCSAYQLEHLAALRAACLDELQHRDPVAFERWLPTARAAGDPARFFCPPQHH